MSVQQTKPTSIEEFLANTDRIAENEHGLSSDKLRLMKLQVVMPRCLVLGAAALRSEGEDISLRAETWAAESAGIPEGHLTRVRNETAATLGHYVAQQIPTLEFTPEVSRQLADTPPLGYHRMRGLVLEVAHIERYQLQDPTEQVRRVFDV